MRPLLLLLALAGCDTGGSDPKDDTGTPDTAPPEDTGPDLAVDLSAAPAFDPILGGPLALTVTAPPAATLTVTVEDATGAVIATPEGAWDGRDDAGAWAPAGPYTVRAVAAFGDERVEDVAQVRMVRCGVGSAWAEGDDGVSATSVALWWHGSRALQDLALPFVSLASLEDETEVAAVFPAPASDLDVAPGEGGNEPRAFTWDSRPILTLELGEDTVLGSTGLEGAGVRLVVPGWTALSGADPVAPGVPIVLQADAALAAGPSVVEDTLSLTFEVDGDDGLARAIGTQDLPVRWYALLDAPTFDVARENHTAWVAAVDPALRALDGVAPDPAAVLDALVEWVYNDHGLVYDTRYGASVYTQYPTGNFDRAIFDFTSYLARRYGSTVNCSDCASIMVGYANMVGAPLDYAIILSNFQLNYILAIGCPEFTHCPFGAGGCGFSYHAVTTDDDAATIWDATLALDGDEDPSAEPNTVLMVESIPGDEYLERLVMSGNARYQYFQQVGLQ